MWGGTAGTQVEHVTNKPDPGVEQHIRDIIAQLPPKSDLRLELSNGAIGDGVCLHWMDEMRKQGIKKAVVEIGIQFDRYGRAKEMAVKGIELFDNYGDGMSVSDADKLNKIGSRGLAQTQTDLA